MSARSGVGPVFLDFPIDLFPPIVVGALWILSKPLLFRKDTEDEAAIELLRAQGRWGILQTDLQLE